MQKLLQMPTRKNTDLYDQKLRTTTIKNEAYSVILILFYVYLLFESFFIMTWFIQLSLAEPLIFRFPFFI